MNDVAASADERPEPAGPALLTNMRLATATLAAAQEGGEGSPRLCLLYGHSGYGKSVAAAYVAARTEAAYVEANSVMTRLSLLEAIAGEIGVLQPQKTAHRLLEQIKDRLNAEPRPLIVDETDYIVQKKAIEIIRDIHDGTSVPIMMIGEETLPAKLKSWERFDNRIIASTPAQPATLDDALRLRDHYCLRVRLADDLVEAILEGSRSVTRRIVVNLRQAQRIASDAGQARIDLAWWRSQGTPFLTGDLPARRKAAR